MSESPVAPMSDPFPSRRTRPRVAITLGDPRGIGPEVTAKALASRDLREVADFVVIGPEAVMPTATEGMETFPIAPWQPGADVSVAGRVAGEAIRIAVDFALRGQVDAVVTSPIDKAAFRAGGWHFPGHTEMLQQLCAVPAVGMMMSAETTLLGGGLRVVLATTHMALREVFTALGPEMLVEQARLTHAALRSWWRIEQPRIAFCALNPHAGDGGLFGDEEARVIEPAIARLATAGLPVDGPIPADTVFTRALRGEWDAVIAPYHDVGMAAFKTAAFGHGVNVTLGLPFPRTSPDHGTAIDIAGRGVADPASMIEAIRLALRLTRSFDREHSSY